MIRSHKIPSLSEIVTRTDSTQIGNATTVAQNAIFRPTGAVKGPPILKKLWAFGSARTPLQEMQAITHPTIARTLNSTDKTVAVRVYNNGKSFLYLYNLNPISGAPVGPRGAFYLGDDLSYSGIHDMESGPPLYEVLATGLSESARWFGEMQAGQLNCQNGVDDSIAVDIRRTLTPGKWRKRGSNEKPSKPTVSLIEPETSVNVQASRTVSPRAGSVPLVFTAHLENFPGERGNLRISVKISYNVYGFGISSELSGEGTIASPFVYTINTSPTASSNNQVVAFVNTDTNALPILTASTPTPNATADTYTEGAAVLLSGGIGTGTSTGLSGEVTNIMSRYWDGGVKNLGYEGPSSDPSDEVVIASASSKDIVTTVDISESAEGGRFSHANAGIRIYKRYGEANLVWNLMNEDAPLPNTHREANVVADTVNNKLWRLSRTIGTSSVAATDILTATTGAVPANLDRMVIEVVNGSASVWTEYVVFGVSGSTFQLSVAESPLVAIALADTTGRTAHIVTSHTWTTSDVAKVTGTSPPTGLNATDRYYIQSAGTRWVKLSATRNGTPIVITSSGTNPALKMVAVLSVIGSNSEPGRAMSPDQNRPPAHRYMTMAGTFNWCAGIPSRETDVLSSKDQQRDEKCPEGVDITDVDQISKSRGSPSFKLSGMWSDKRLLHIHCEDGVIVIDPADTTNQQEPMVNAGMVNGACVATTSGNRIIFLTSSRELLSFNGARYGDRSSASLSDDAMEYIRARISINDMEKYPERCCMMHDASTGLLFFWMPKVVDSVVTSVGFAYDTRTKGITGPFDQPVAAYDVCAMETSRGQFIICDVNGYLFWWDTNNQGDNGDIFTQEPIVLHTNGATIPQSLVGFTKKDVTIAGVEYDLWQSHQTILETGMIDAATLGKDGLVKFHGLRWRSVKGSCGIVRVTIIGHNGRESSITYGDMRSKESNMPHEVRITHLDTAAKFRFEVFGGDLKKWIVRDFEVLYE